MDFVGRDEMEDLLYVALVDWYIFVCGGFENGNFEITGGIVVGDFGEANAGLIFHCSDCLPKLARHY